MGLFICVFFDTSYGNISTWKIEIFFVSLYYSLDIRIDTSLETTQSDISFTLSHFSEVEYEDFKTLITKLHDLKCLSQQ